MINRICRAMIFAVALVWLVTPSAGASEIEISLQIGHDTVTINGEELSVAKPYISNDFTLVPLRVISAGFAAHISWNGETQTVKIQYADKTVQLMIGSTSAVIDDQFVELQTAPELVNGTTMVPVRFISQTFGAQIQYEPETRTVNITGDAASAAENEPETEEEISVDIIGGEPVKAYIGDSHYNWTLKYPAFLSFDWQSENGDWIGFTDADGHYYFSIRAEELPASLTDKTLLNQLSEQVYETETILDRQVVDGEHRYARILTKEGETFYDHRAYTNDSHVLVLIMTFYDGESFYKKEVQEQYQSLMDSFVPFFDNNQSDMQDVTVVDDGFRSFVQKDYGISFKVPAEWDTSYSRDYFSNADESAFLYYDISSIEAGGNLEAWSDAMDQRSRQMVLPEYINLSEPEAIKIGENQALISHTTINLGDIELLSTDVLLYHGNHKYWFRIGYTDQMPEQEQQALITTIVESIQVNTDDLPYQLGYIEDDTVYDLAATETYEYSEGLFTIELPQYWEITDQNDTLDATFKGGEFSAGVLDGVSKAEFTNFLDSTIEAGEKLGISEIESKGKAIIDGVVADQYKVTYERDGLVYIETSYIFEKDDETYVVVYEVAAPYATALIQKSIENSIDSFQFAL